MNNDQLLIEYYRLAETIRERHRTLRLQCHEERGAEYTREGRQITNPVDSCISTFFARVKEARCVVDGSQTFEAAREEVLGEMELCEVCTKKLSALSDLRKLRPKMGVMKRRLNAAGKRLIKEESK